MLRQFENVGAIRRDCDNIILRYDQACLQIITNESVTFWSQYEECEDCMLLETAKLPSTRRIVLETLSPLRYAIKNGNGEICNGTQFTQFFLCLLSCYEAFLNRFLNNDIYK